MMHNDAFTKIMDSDSEGLETDSATENSMQLFHRVSLINKIVFQCSNTS